MSPPEGREEQAKRDLARIAREGETLGGTAMDAATPRHDSDDDAVEKLGKRIGRIFAFAALPFALFYFGRTAGWF